MSMTQSNDTELQELLQDVQSGKTQLPEFQRDWTWNDNRIRGLLASLTQGYPMGAVMLLDCSGTEMNLQYRAVSGVTTNRKPDFLILDGQQRLTALYQTLFSLKPVCTKDEKGNQFKCFYYFSIKGCLSRNEDRLASIIAVPESKIKKKFNGEIILDLSSRELEYKNKMFPVNMLFDTDNECDSEDWNNGYRDFWDNSKEINDEIKEFKKIIKNVATHYKLPVIKLDKSTPREAVCQIFENVNTGGVPLTVFELVTASYAMHKEENTDDYFNLRNDWEKCRKLIRECGENIQTDIFNGIDETAFLTTVCLYSSYKMKLSSGKAVSCKKRDVLNLDFDDYKKNRFHVVEGFEIAKEFLVQYQKVYRMKDLPYTTQIIPLAAICAYLKRKECFKPRNLKILSKWYWCGIFGEMYGGANETRYVNDIEDVIDEILGKESLQRTIRAANFSAARLLSLKTRGSAAYKGILALLYKNGCHDFMNPTCIDSMASIPDIHHIFPEAYCRNKIPSEKYDSIINKTPILSGTNRTIGGNAPSKYLKIILESCNLTEEELKCRIESHLINYELLKADNFNQFFVERAKALLECIEKAMDKEISDRNTENTRNLYGTNL